MILLSEPAKNVFKATMS